jgi:hypothetical protein
MSPFKSLKQERFMYSQHPEIARKWNKEEHMAKKKIKKAKKKQTQADRNMRLAKRMNHPSVMNGGY